MVRRVWDIAARPGARELADGAWGFRVSSLGRDMEAAIFGEATPRAVGPRFTDTSVPLRALRLRVLCVSSSADGPSTSDPSSGSALAAMLGEIEN